MKNLDRKIFLGIGVIILFASCQKTQTSTPVAARESLSTSEKIVSPGNATDRAEVDYNTFFGPTVQMGDGRARSWANITHDDKMLEVGVEMTSGALTGLPEHPEDFAASTFVLSLHQKAKALTAFDHIVVNWNGHGHEPDHVFDVTHFDFHFYKISLDERLAIPPYEIAPAMFDADPPTANMPHCTCIPLVAKYFATQDYYVQKNCYRKNSQLLPRLHSK